MTGSRLTVAVAALVAVPLVGYALLALAGGGPTFPGGRSECALRADAHSTEKVEVVAAHVARVSAAEALRDRLVARGFENVYVEADGCGWWKVTNDTVDSYSQGASLVDAFRRAGFDARLELDPVA